MDSVVVDRVAPKDPNHIGEMMRSGDLRAQYEAIREQSVTILVRRDEEITIVSDIA